MNKEAFNYGLFLLSKRDYSVFKLTQKLSLRKYNPQEIQEVISRLEELQYLNETRYTRVKIRSLLLRNYSNNYIINKLKQEKINIMAEQINEIKEQENIVTLDQIDELLDKKMRNKTLPDDLLELKKLEQKLMRFLLSKGHDFSDASRKIRERLK